MFIYYNENAILSLDIISSMKLLVLPYMLIALRTVRLENEICEGDTEKYERICRDE